DIHAAVDFQADVAPAGIDQGSRLAQLAEGRRNELLAAKTGVDAHQQDHVDLVHDVPERVQRSGRVEYQAGLRPAIADQLQGAVDMVAGFRVEGDVAGTGIEEVADHAVPRTHHQVHVDGGADAVA